MTKSEKLQGLRQELRNQAAGRDLASFIMKNTESPELAARAAELKAGAEQRLSELHPEKVLKSL